MAYAELEPFGSYLDDLRHGRGMALTANINRDPKIRPEPFSAADFMLAPSETSPAPEPETAECIASRIKTELFRM